MGAKMDRLDSGASDESVDRSWMPQETMQGPPGELRIVLVGKTGVGKSASGNTILGREAFTSKASSNAVTSECREQACEMNGQKIVVVDTPGLFDPNIPNPVIAEEISKCVVMSAPGPHAFILVIQASRFTKEEASAVSDIQTLFGKEAAKYMMVLFTRKDDLEGKPINNYIAECPEDLKKVILSCGNRYVAVNNRTKVQEEREQQAQELITQIVKMVKANGGRCYTTEMFRKVEAKIQRKQKEIEEERRRSGLKDERWDTSREEAKQRFMENILAALKTGLKVLLTLADIAVTLAKIFE